MADTFVSKKSARPVMETMEGRTLFSTAPVFGQYPPIIISKVYPDQPKSSAGHTPPPVMSPVPGAPVLPPASPVEPVLPPALPPTAPAEPVAPPVQSTIADAPEGLRARGYRKSKLICLKWKSVDSSADTVVVEYSTDGQTFTTLAMLDADQKKYGAKHLDRSKTYTFRVYTLNADGEASKVAEIEAKWSCK